MPYKNQNLKAYTNGAEILSQKFDRSGAYSDDIHSVFDLCDVENAKVLELVCACFEFRFSTC